MNFCPYCGNKLIEGHIFCGKCGKPIASISETITNNPVSSGKSALDVLIVGIPIVMLLLVFIAPMFSLTPPRQSDVVNAINFTGFDTMVREATITYSEFGYGTQTAKVALFEENFIFLIYFNWLIIIFPIIFCIMGMFKVRSGFKRTGAENKPLSNLFALGITGIIVFIIYVIVCLNFIARETVRDMDSWGSIVTDTVRNKNLHTAIGVFLMGAAYITYCVIVKMRQYEALKQMPEEDDDDEDSRFKWRCKKCSKVNQEDDNVCISCGKQRRLKAEYSCKTCKKEVSIDDTQCKNCGRQLDKVE